MSGNFNEEKRMLRMYWKLWKGRIIEWDQIPDHYKRLIRRYYLGENNETDSKKDTS